ncbi:MAG: F0F1 ATP synthase subunit gamma [Bacilli bacterium]|nr:F0F1 ATP synthase subunit gamma [Bacilli bacterium]
MSVKNTVKVMNFHALLRVPEARKKVDLAFEYERELKYIISSIINNRIFKQERLSLELDENAKELNIYIGSDLGFCANFNSNIMNYLRTDNDRNDKIIIGKKIRLSVDNEILFISNEEFEEKFDDIFNIVLDGLLDYRYSKINLIYTHYYNISRQEIVKRTILPFDYGGDILDEEERKEISKLDDFVVEGDLNYIIWNLISIYITMEIRIAKAWSYATENVQRQTFTDNSLKKIEDKEEEKKKEELKIKKAKEFKTIVEMNNRKIRTKKEE